ncbi:disease resistance protein RPM1-like [Rosa sericea]
MAMASAAIDLLLGKIVSFLDDQLSLLGGVHDELEEIKRELIVMKAFLEDAERKGVLSEVEKTWVANVRDVSVDVEDFIDEFTYHINKQRSWSPFTRTFRKSLRFPKNLWERHRIATKLQKIIKIIKAIPERSLRYGVKRIEGVSYSHYDPDRLRILRESSLFLQDDEVVGIIDAKEKLVTMLLSSQAQRTVISVVGMGGSGKTTLVAKTFNGQTVKQHFDCCAWITVSQTYTVEDLLRVIMKELLRAVKEQIPVDLSDMSYSHLVEMLASYLKEKRYLIVLDDVWDINLWRKISAALPDGPHGSRVMLTTRKEDIASFPFGLGSYVHHVQPLNKSEAWHLFSMKAFFSCPNSCCPTELEHIARDLVDKCEGLPLGIVALGALMSTKSVLSEWMKVYSSLNWELCNNPRLEVVKSILLLSFNDLPYRLKHCFLYCCVFPEDYVIQCRRLIRLWIAEGFVEQVRGAKTEEIAESYMAELTCRCMLQVVEREPSGRAETFRMHDLLRELCISISEAETFCTIYNDQEPAKESKARRVSMQANSRALRNPKDISKVRTFFMFAAFSLNYLPSGFQLLRILDLEDVPIVELPDDIVNCFNLMYLNLRSTKVKELPKDIGKLSNLEMLNISNSKIRLLPVGILKLQKLHHLLMLHFNDQKLCSFDCLDGCTQAPPGICKLKRLQVLDTVKVEGELIEQLQSMTQLTRLGLANVREADEKDLCKALENMKLIEQLNVMTTDEDEVLRMDALAEGPPMLNTLFLTGKLERIPLWFHSLHNLSYLALLWSRVTHDFLPCIQELPNLTRLWLINAYTGDELVFRSGFRKLTELILLNFSQLSVIIIEKGVMPALKTLDIWECMQLKQIPRGIEHLTNLKQLTLLGVPNELIECIRGEGSMDNSKVKQIPNIGYCYKTRFGWSHGRTR